jgi:hypothetical protein
MKYTSPKFAAAAAAVLAFAAVPSHALTLAPVGPGATTAMFQAFVGGGNTFTDTWTFNLTRAGSIAATISSAYDVNGPKVQNIVFGSPTVLAGIPFVFSSDGVGVSAQGEAPHTLIGPGSYTLVVSGQNDGNFISSFDGAVDFLPAVPEPAGWALLLFGIGAVGALARSRHRVAPAA